MTAPTVQLIRHDHPVRTLREQWIDYEDERHPPEWEAVDDPALRAFRQLAEDNDFYSLDADRVRAESAGAQFSTYWHCTVIGFDAPGASEESYCTYWSPVSSNQDPLTGFGAGPDSSLIGHFARSATPDDWRIRALLLVVSTPFIHMSFERTDDGPLVRGAMEGGPYVYRFLRLAD